MILFNYHSDEKIGMLKTGMSIAETRNVIKSGYNFCKKSEYKKDYDHFRSIGIIAYYNDAGILSEIKLCDKYSIFMYKNINLFSNYLKIKNKLSEINAIFNSENEAVNEGMELENKKLGLYAPDLVLDPKDPDNEKATVKSITVNIIKGCSVSFERLISNHIPSKETYLGSKTSSNDGPAIRMSYEDQKYFASHGKSKIAKQYREMQKKLVQKEKLMEAICMDEDEIKSKTSSRYSIVLKELKDFARTLNPKDFIVKN